MPPMPGFSPEGDYRSSSPSEIRAATSRSFRSGSDQRAYQARAIISSDMATPFDLGERAHLPRTTLKLAPEEHQFIFTTHHAVCDGWSLALCFMSSHRSIRTRGRQILRFRAVISFRLC